MFFLIIRPPIDVGRPNNLYKENVDIEGFSASKEYFELDTYDVISFNGSIELPQCFQNEMSSSCSRTSLEK